MARIIWRQLRKTWVVQLAVVALFAAAVVVLMIYEGFINHQSISTSLNIESQMSETVLLVKTAVPQQVPDLSRIMYVGFAAAWRHGNLESNFGKVPCALFTPTPYATPLAPPGTVLIPQVIANKFGISEGDTLVLFENGKEFRLRVHQVIDRSPAGLDYGFGDRLLVFTGVNQNSDYFLYRQISPSRASAMLQIKALHPSGIVEDSSTEHGTGAALVKNRYSHATQAKSTLIMFLALAFLTAKVLSFLDNRRVLAILKAVGLTNGEVATAICWEAVVAPVAGIWLGLFTGWQVVRALEGKGLAMSGYVAISALVATMPALLLGLFVPGRLAHMATVLELLFQRNVALFYDMVQGTSRRLPALDGYVAQGVHFLKLDVVDGAFDGFIIRRLGDMVKQGDVIARGLSWWGLKVREYVAPFEGRIVFFQEDTGLVGIKPLQ